MERLTNSDVGDHLHQFLSLGGRRYLFHLGHPSGSRSVRLSGTHFGCLGFPPFRLCIWLGLEEEYCIWGSEGVLGGGILFVWGKFLGICQVVHVGYFGVLCLEKFVRVDFYSSSLLCPTV